MHNTKLQNSGEFSGQKFYIGLDVRKKSWAAILFVTFSEFTRNKCFFS